MELAVGIDTILALDVFGLALIFVFATIEVLPRFAVNIKRITFSRFVN